MSLFLPRVRLLSLRIRWLMLHASRTGPFVFGCQDSGFLLDGEKIPFPEVPVPLVVPYIIDHVVSRRFPGAWRFCPSSAYGQVRPFTGRPAQSSAVVVVGPMLRLLLGWLVAFVMVYLKCAYMPTVS